MSIELTLSNGRMLGFMPGLPVDYSGPVLHGAVSRHAKNNTEEIFVQEVAGEEYAIRFIDGKFISRVRADSGMQHTGLYCYFMLSSSMRADIERVGKFHLRRHCFSCVYAEPGKGRLRYGMNQEFQSLCIYYSPRYLQELHVYFPELIKVVNGQPALLLPERVGAMMFSMLEITTQMLHYPYNTGAWQLYYDIKVRELLLHVLHIAFRKRTKMKPFTPWELARITQAKNILENVMGGKPPSITELSRQVGLNVFRLRAGFHYYFDAGVMEWLWELRMQWAKELLMNSNRPIKEICALVGYPRTTNFITSFKRRFGVTPGSLRRS